MITASDTRHRQLDQIEVHRRRIDDHDLRIGGFEHVQVDLQVLHILQQIRVDPGGRGAATNR